MTSPLVSVMSSGQNALTKADLGAENGEVKAVFARLEAKLDAQQTAFTESSTD